MKAFFLVLPRHMVMTESYNSILYPYRDDDFVFAKNCKTLLFDVSIGTSE